MNNYFRKYIQSIDKHQAFFDKIFAETERKFFAKLIKIAETEKYEIYRFCTFRKSASKPQILHFLVQIGVFGSKISKNWAMFPETEQNFPKTEQIFPKLSKIFAETPKYEIYRYFKNL